jgi:hypothetical protein
MNAESNTRTRRDLRHHRASLHLLARWYRRTSRQPIRACIDAALAELASYPDGWKGPECADRERTRVDTNIETRESRAHPES